jgi:predicted CoA-substrate-specific enzyme activase
MSTITCGLDLGAGTIKAILMEDGEKILGKDIIKTGGRPADSAEKLLERFYRDVGIKKIDIDYLSTTGFSRYLYKDRDLQLSDITTNAKGAHFLFPKTITVLDVGTQSTRAIHTSETGRVTKFKFTEKCAAGAGRFVERCSKYLQIPMDEMGPVALKSSNPRQISSVCAVLAETEIINLIAEEIEISDIVMGVFVSIANRATTLARRVGLNPELTLTGGLVKSPGMVRALEKTTGIKVNISELGHYAGALGAAILSYRRIQQLQAQHA